MISEVSKVLNDSAAFLSTMVDTVKKLIEVKWAIKDKAKLRVMWEEVERLTYQLALLSVTQRYRPGVLFSIDAFLDCPRRLRPDAWKALQNSCARVQKQVSLTLTMIEDRDSALILTPGIDHVIDQLKQRQAVLAQLQVVKPPSSRRELSELRQFRQAYEIFVSELRDLLNSLRTQLWSYRVGQVIDHAGQQWRIVSLQPGNPEYQITVEPVKGTISESALPKRHFSVEYAEVIAVDQGQQTPSWLTNADKPGPDLVVMAIDRERRRRLTAAVVTAVIILLVVAALAYWVFLR
jgi:hypothetical protein